jgi:hypothetical protein
MIKKRLLFLILLTLVGGFLFVPYSNDSWNVSIENWLIFPFGSALVVALFGWIGLKLADKTNLPMPILRKWEKKEKIKASDWKVLLIPAIGGAALAFLIVSLNQVFDPPKNPGTLLMRILTVPWAATFTEVISHLLVMSLLVLLLKNNWAAIIISSLLFVALFHLQNIEGELETTIFLSAGNFAGSTLTGWFYSKYGFESALAGHAVMHLILLSIN